MASTICLYAGVAELKSIRILIGLFTVHVQCTATAARVKP